MSGSYMGRKIDVHTTCISRCIFQFTRQLFEYRQLTTPMFFNNRFSWIIRYNLKVSMNLLQGCFRILQITTQLGQNSIPNLDLKSQVNHKRIVLYRSEITLSLIFPDCVMPILWHYTKFLEQLIAIYNKTSTTKVKVTKFHYQSQRNQLKVFEQYPTLVSQI